ncbi:GMC family oxidoreductase N-terminal domain-containing protein [Alphaproteobacteria bacterium]|nr:GMC family oxidoreductase N-terminal domain-containing protein [Alphaproteobacteria bacterium]
MIYDITVVGFGVGGLAAVLEIMKYSPKARVCIIGGGKEYKFENNFGVSIAKYYSSGGIVPIVGRPSISFGEPDVFGGGQIVNGGLFWNIPTHKKEYLSLKFPNSAFADDRWDEVFRDMSDLMGVSIQPLGSAQQNIVSRKLLELGNIGAVRVPRAVADCQFANRCGAGCPHEKKKTPLNYVKYLSEIGVDIFHGRVRNIVRDSNKISVKFNGRSIETQKLVLSAGVTQTPRLLKNSGLISERVWPLRLHLNLRFLAFFNEVINPWDATMLAAQVQRGLPNGWVLMTKNFNDAEFLEYLNSLPAEINKNKLWDKRSNLALFTVMVDPSDSSFNFTSVLGQTVGAWSLGPKDFELIKSALSESYEILKDIGAISAIGNGLEHEGLVQINKIIKLNFGVVPKSLKIMSVHGMSSVPMGSKYVREEDGSLRDDTRIMIADASSIPCSLGESPQGTIMTLTSLNVRRWLNG